MNRVLTTVLAVALLLGLGALAVLALPGASTPLAAAPFVSAAPDAQEVTPDAVAAPDAPEALEYYFIALPLDSQDQFTAAGATWDADGLGDFIGPGVSQVLQWDEMAEPAGWQVRFPTAGRGVLFDLRVGWPYFVLVDGSVTVDTVSFVGDVPPAGTPQRILQGGDPCVYNAIMVPLNRDDISDQTELGAALVNADQVLSWSADEQRWLIYYPKAGRGAPFEVKIGYPYFACMSADTTWP